jgi:hypothetical protein
MQVKFFMRSRTDQWSLYLTITKKNNGKREYLPSEFLFRNIQSADEFSCTVWSVANSLTNFRLDRAMNLDVRAPRNKNKTPSKRWRLLFDRKRWRLLFPETPINHGDGLLHRPAWRLHSNMGVEPHSTCMVSLL